jgi:hypothetical protein
MEVGQLVHSLISERLKMNVERICVVADETHDIDLVVGENLLARFDYCIYRLFGIVAENAEINKSVVNSLDGIGAEMADIGQGITDYVVKRNDKRELDEKGEASADGIVIFLLIKVHYLLLHLLLGSLVRSACISLADSHFLRAELGLLLLTLLLLYAKREEYYLSDNSEQKKS